MSGSKTTHIFVIWYWSILNLPTRYSIQILSLTQDLALCCIKSPEGLRCSDFNGMWEMGTGARGWSGLLQVERGHVQGWHPARHLHWLVKSRRWAHAGAVCWSARSSTTIPPFCYWISLVKLFITNWINTSSVIVSGMVAAEADMLNLPFDNESFDVVIEKGAMVSSIQSQALPHFPAGFRV